MFNPMASIISKPEATIDDLYKVEGKAELVNGEIVHLMATGSMPGYAGDEIFAWLRDYVKRVGYGRAVGDNKAFVVDLPHRKSFSPDAAFSRLSDFGCPFVGAITGAGGDEGWASAGLGAGCSMTISLTACRTLFRPSAAKLTSS